MNFFKKPFVLMVTAFMTASFVNTTALASYGCDCETGHIHNEDCYECTKNYDLICKEEEHSHIEECFSLHTHSESCKNLICSISENTLICTDTEHTHTEECYEYHSHENLCYEIICGIPENSTQLSCEKTPHAHTLENCFKEHLHDNITCEPHLICEKSVFHVHNSSCFKPIDGKSWPQVSLCFEPSCEYANMKTHTHEISCLSSENKEAIISAYPKASYSVPNFSEPFIFSEVQTYLNGGIVFHDPSTKDDTIPQLFMLANMQGMTKGDTWTYDESHRFEAGLSNYVPAYCCDLDTSIVRHTMYRQVNLEDSGYYDKETAQKIRTVILNSYPFLSMEEFCSRLKKAGVTDAELMDEATMIAGTQFAVWYFSNSNTEEGFHYWYTSPSGKYPALTALWKTGDKKSFNPEIGQRVASIKDYLVSLANISPTKAPKSQIIVSQVDVTNLVATPNEENTYDLQLEVSLNADYIPTENTGIIISAKTESGLSESIEAAGGKIYYLELKGYTPGENITVTVYGTQYIPFGAYFFEPFSENEEDIRSISQNLVGVNSGIIPVGDSVTLSPVSITFRKISENGETLTDAEFKLSYINPYGKTIDIDTFTVDENGEFIIEGLMAGAKYRLTEISAPNGYRLPKKGITFKISGEGHGEISLIESGPGVSLDFDGENIILSSTNYKIPPFNNDDGDDGYEADPKPTPSPEPEIPSAPETIPENSTETSPEIIIKTPESYSIPEPEDLVLDNVPKTGDSSNFWNALLIISGSGIIGSDIIRRKKNNAK